MPLSSEPCYEGPSGTEWVGLCAPGARSCAPDGGAWGPCEGQVLPTSETCGSPGDDDCDGTPNEEGPDCQCVPGSIVSCFSGPPEAVGVGVCVAGEQVCAPSGLGFGPCQGEVVPTPELCSTDVDDDCDGAVNEEGVDCVCTPFAAVPCYDGPPETAGVGLCVAGVAQCDSKGLSLSACAGQVLPGVEVCSGDVVDEDCDGEVNEGGPGCVCAPGVIESCYTGPPASIDRGPCHGGERQCNATGTAFGLCLGEVVPILDVCGTERREDCFHHYPECPAVCAGFETVMPVEPGDVVTPGSGQNSFGQAGWFLHQGASGPRFLGTPGIGVPVTVTDLAPTGLFELHAMTTYQIHGYLDGSIDIAGPGNVGTGLVTVVLWHPTPHAKPSVGGNYGDRLYASHPDRLVTFEGTSHLFGQAFTAPYGGRDVLVGDQTGWSTLIGGPGDEHVVAVSESPMLDFAMTFDQPVQLGGYVVDPAVEGGLALVRSRGHAIEEPITFGPHPGIEVVQVSGVYSIYTLVLLEFTEAITIDGVDVPAYGDGLRDFAVIAFDLYSSEVEWSRVCRGPGDDRVTSVATHTLQYFNSFFTGRSAGALECDDVAGPIPEGDFIWIDKRTPQLPAASYFFPLHGLEQAVVMPHMLVAKHVGPTTDLACDQPAPQVPSWIAMRLPL